jgi:hypothetical protein
VYEVKSPTTALYSFVIAPLVNREGRRITDLFNHPAYGRSFCQPSGRILDPVGKLFTQGWEPRLSQNEPTLYDTNGRLVICAPMKNNVYPVTLQTIYPDFGLIAGETDGEVPDELLDVRLDHAHDPLVAYSTREESSGISLYDWRRRMGHRSMQTISCDWVGAERRTWRPAEAQHLPILCACKGATTPIQIWTHARRSHWNLSTAIWSVPCLSNRSVVASTALSL